MYIYIYISIGINHIGDITTFWIFLRLFFDQFSRISMWLSKAQFWDLMGILPGNMILWENVMGVVYGMQSGNTGCLWNGYIYIYILKRMSLYIGVRFLPKWDSLRCVDEFLMNVCCPFFSHLFGPLFPAMASLMENDDWPLDGLGCTPLISTDRFSMVFWGVLFGEKLSPEERMAFQLYHPLYYWLIASLSCNCLGKSQFSITPNVKCQNNMKLVMLWQYNHNI